MKLTQILLLASSGTLALAACAPANQPVAPASASPVAQRVTSESVVKVSAQPVQLAAGQSGEAAVRITIQSGYHVNANPPTFPYLKATTLVVPPAEGISLGTITYPKALQKKFAFAEKELAVYEGEAEVKAQLKVDKTTPKGERSVPAEMRIQACDDQVCYAPGTITFAIPVTIK